MFEEVRSQTTDVREQKTDDPSSLFELRRGKQKTEDPSSL